MTIIGTADHCLLLKSTRPVAKNAAALGLPQLEALSGPDPG